MSNVFSSPTDETGSDNRVIRARTITDIADDNGTYYVLKRELDAIEVIGQMVLSKPLLITAGHKLIWYSQLNSANSVLCLNADANIVTLPLLSGGITSFTDNTTTTLVNSVAHGLKIGDVVKIIDSRITEYNGDFEVVTVTDDTFEIAVAFNTVDGICRWVQTSGAITTITLLTGTTYSMAVNDNSFAVDDWINISNSDQGDIDGTWQISAIATNAITIDFGATITSTTANLDTTVTNVESTRMYFIELTGTTTSSLFNIQGDPTRTTTVLERTFVVPINPSTGAIDDTRMFQLGEVRDCLLCFIGSEGALRNGGGLRAFDNERVTLIDLAAYTRIDAAFETQEYYPVVRTGGNTTQLMAYQTSITERVENQSIMECPDTVGEDFRDLVSFLSDTSPGSLFAKGVYARCSGTSTDDGNGFAEFPIGTGEFDRYRVGDFVSILETSSYSGDTGSITAINALSIVTDIAYAAAISTDTEGSVTANADGTVGIQVDSITGFVAGDYFTITGATPTAYNQTYKLLSISGSDLVVNSDISDAITVQGAVTSDASPLILDISMASLDQTDARISATQNTNEKESMSTVDIFIEPNATVPNPYVTINTTAEDVFVPFVDSESTPATWVTNFTERFTVDTAGIITYTGQEDADFFASWSSVIQVTGGGVGEIALVPYVNGAVISNLTNAIYNNTGIVQISGNGIISLSKGDTIQLFVANTDGTAQLQALQCKLELVKGG